ncbi:MAG: HAD-IA family hydrolase [Thermoplasmata archaeon]|nr:HAD-IA family hydrolase [Thermoplasmata archaeon]
MPEDWWPRVGELIASVGGEAGSAALEEWTSVPLEHVEHSASKEHYDRWSADRLRALLAACGLSGPAADGILQIIEDARSKETVAITDGALGVIDELHARGILVGLCSNWDWDLDRQLVGNGVAERFDAIACSARVGYRKPHERIFGEVLAALGTAPSETVFVGDDWGADIEGARAMGMTPVHAGWAIACRVEEHGTVRCLGSLSELLELPSLSRSD